MNTLPIPIEDDFPEEFECDKCRDTGFRFDDSSRARPCQCKAAESYWHSAACMAGVPEIWWSTTLDSIEEEDEVQVYVKDVLKELAQLVRVRRSAQRRPMRGLLLYGSVGPGKSMLLAGFANSLIRQGLRVDWRNVPGLYFDALAAQKDDAGITRLLDYLALPDVLILDDLGAQKASEFAESVIYSVLNDRIEAGKLLVASSNLEPDKLAEQIGERNASRLAGLCYSTPVPGEDRRRNPPAGLLTAPK